MKKLTVLMLTAVFAVAAYAEDTYDSCYKSGLASYKARKYAAAIKDFDKAIELAPKAINKALSLYYKAYCLYYLKKYKAAGDEHAKVADLKDLSADYKVNYAAQGIIDYALAKDYDAAHALADKLAALEITKDTYKHRVVYNKAYAFNCQKKHDEAHKVLDTVIKDVDPKNIWRYNLDMQKLSAYNGKKDYQALLDAFPDSYIKTVIPARQYTYYYNRGVALYSLKKYAEAVKEFEKVNKLNDKYSYSYYFLGLSYKLLKQNDKALTAFEKMATTSKSPSVQHSALYNMAQVLYLIKEYQKSVDVCKKICEYPKMTDRCKGYALLYSYYPLLKLGKKDEAKANLEKLVKLKGAAGSHKKSATAFLKKL